LPFIRETEEDYRPILTPLIDVVFLLIIFFLVSTEFIDLSKKVKIQLPQSDSSQNSERKLKNVIELSQDGRIFLNGQAVALGNLSNQLAQKDPKRPLVIRADKRAPYGEVVSIMGICQSLGFQEIDAAVKEP